MNRLIHHSARAGAALLLLAAAACGGSETSDSAQPEGRNTTEVAAAATAVKTADSDFGTILVDSEGMTLYMFDPDEQGKSVCDAECLKAWPPVEGPADAGSGVDESMLGTAKATDGTTMATYNDWPLYYWVDDKKPGDVTGQAVGDVWWVMGPDGKPIREMPQALAGSR